MCSTNNSRSYMHPANRVRGAGEWARVHAAVTLKCGKVWRGSVQPRERPLSKGGVTGAGEQGRGMRKVVAFLVNRVAMFAVMKAP